MAPRFTVSLVTFNAGQWLAGCLASLAAQELTDYELLVVDNASVDDSVAHLRAAAAGDTRIVVDAWAENRGYAVAHNFNLFRAAGAYVLLLNQDVVLDPSFLAAAARVLDGRADVGAVQGLIMRLRRDGERSAYIDTTGLVLYRDRRCVARRQGEEVLPADNTPGPIWGVDGPAAVYRRTTAIDAALPRTAGGLEVLDEDFFMYKEDVDLAWRLAALGWTTWYEPAAVAWHARTADGGRQRNWLDVARSRWSIPPWIRRVSWRNQRLMQIKNETSSALKRDFPWIARREIVAFAFMVLFDPMRLPALIDLVATAPRMAPKRRALHRLLERRAQSRLTGGESGEVVGQGSPPAPHANSK